MTQPDVGQVSKPGISRLKDYTTIVILSELRERRISAEFQVWQSAIIPSCGRIDDLRCMTLN
jgi:hypothetical protein